MSVAGTVSLQNATVITATFSQNPSFGVGRVADKMAQQVKAGSCHTRLDDQTSISGTHMVDRKPTPSDLHVHTMGHTSFPDPHAK